MCSIGTWAHHESLSSGTPTFEFVESSAAAIAIILDLAGRNRPSARRPRFSQVPNLDVLSRSRTSSPKRRNCGFSENRQRLPIPGDNSPFRQQFTTDAKGISRQLIAIAKYCGVYADLFCSGLEPSAKKPFYDNAVLRQVVVKVCP